MPHRFSKINLNSLLGVCSVFQSCGIPPPSPIARPISTVAKLAMTVLDRNLVFRAMDPAMVVPNDMRHVRFSLLMFIA